MLSEIGLIALVFAFIAAIYAIIASTLGAWRHHENSIVSGRNAALATFPLLIVAAGALLVALLTKDYQNTYVWSVTDPQTPMFYRFTALWGSQKGSLLFWCLTMSAFSFGAVWFNWHSDRRLMPYTIAFMMATLAFFIGITLVLENPFQRWWLDATTGETFAALLVPANAAIPPHSLLASTASGLNPLLRHFGMIIHPPMLYMGFVGFVVPFAFAMAALASGDLSTNWIRATRRWALIAWIFLSLGLILGGRWAYDVLGWGGYWGWDPVENAAFLPWLIGTAFIHSVMIQQKRGMLKVWNMFLVIFTFSAVLFGTFATRSGVIESVHSFARSEIGYPMLIFWASMTIIGVGLLLWRWNRGELRDERSNTSLLSRESLFVLNNVIFMALTLTIFFGSFGLPIFSELFMDTEITVGTEYFMIVTPPLFAALYVLMGVAPLSAWGASSAARLSSALFVPMLLTVVTLVLLIFATPMTPVAFIGYGVVLLAGYVALYEIFRGVRARMLTRQENPLQALVKLFGRNQQRYGGYIVHVGVVIIGLGVIGSTVFQYETRRTLAMGEVEQIDSQYAVRYDDYQEGVASDGRRLHVASLTLLQNGNPIATIQPREDDFGEMSMMIAGAHSTLSNDFYVLLDAWDTQRGLAAFVLYINPLVNFVWWGGIVLIIGTLIAAWPKQVVPRSLRARHTTPAAEGLQTT